jgi:quinol monooxygenase YgiN
MPENRDSVLVMIQLVAPEGLGDSLVSTIKPLTGMIRSNAGCSSCHIYQDSQNPEEMVLLQEWDSEHLFAAHVVSKEYRYILEWMEMSSTKPQVTVCKKPDRGGFKLITDLLNVSKKQTTSSVTTVPAGSGKQL